MDYSFGNFKLPRRRAPPAVATAGSRARVTDGAPAPTSSTSRPSTSRTSTRATRPAKFDALAAPIVDNLGAPDIIALEEVQDNNGPTNDGIVDAAATFDDADRGDRRPPAARPYQFRQIDPVDDQDGGEPGGNIRVGFLFRTDRGLAFVDRPGGGLDHADDGRRRPRRRRS